MRLRGFYVDDSGDLGITGSVPLPGVTVLFGANGAGKSRIIELFDGLLTPRGEFRGRQSADSDVYSDGFVVVELDALWSDEGDGSGPDAEWVSQLVNLQPELEGSSGPMLGMLLRHPESVEALSDAHTLAKALSGDLPADTAALGYGLWLLLLSQRLVAYENSPFGSIGWVVDTDALDPACLAFAQWLVDGGLNDAIPAPPESLTRQIAERVLCPRVRYERLFAIGDYPGDERDYDRVRAAHPEPVWIEADPIDVEQHVSALLPSRLWEVGDDEGTLRALPEARAMLEQIERRANDLAPAFVQQQGTIRVRANVNAGPRCSIQMQLRDDGVLLDLASLGSGVRRWVAASVLVACSAAHLPPRWSSSQTTRISPELVLLIDEPELHLHESAQADIATWLSERAQEGAIVLTATHAPAILNLTGANTAFVGVVRRQGQTVLYDFTSDVLGAVDDLAGALGVDRRAWLRLARGTLVVEGQHDLQVITHFFRDQLAALRVVVLPLRGSQNVMAMIDSEFVGRAQIPQWVMLDDVESAALMAGGDLGGLTSAEAKKMAQLLHQKRAGQPIFGLPYPDPDIICALPMEAVQRAFPRALDVTWEAVVETWRSRTSSKPVGFKKHALDQLGLKDVNPDDFVRQVLLRTAPDDAPSDALTAAMTQLSTEVEAYHRPVHGE